MVDWDKRFMKLAEHVASWSKDRSTKVGAVIVDSSTRTVLSLGYNGMVRGIDDDVEERHERPIKYQWAEHAERNAIYNARQILTGATMYSTFYPCSDCARGIIQSGITRLVAYEPDWNHPRWGGDKAFAVAKEMMSEVGLEVVFIEQ